MGGVTEVDVAAAIGRIDEIIIFDPLSKTQIGSIVELQLNLVRQVALGQGITLNFDKSLIGHLAEEGYQPQFGARELRREIRRILEAPLAKEMLSGRVQEGDTVDCTYAQGSGVAFKVTRPAPPDAGKPASPEPKKAKAGGNSKPKQEAAEQRSEGP